MAYFPSLVLAVALQVQTQVPAGPGETSPTLYAIENVPAVNGVAKTQNLVRLSIDRQGQLDKATLVTTDGSFFGDFGRHRIASGRLIVTNHGGVVDLRTQEVVRDERDGDVLGLEGTKLFYRVDNSFRPSGIFCLDLETLEVARVEQGSRWELPGVKSPDGLMSVEERPHDGVIRVHRVGGPTQELGKVAIITRQRSRLPSPPSGLTTHASWWPGRIINSTS